MAVFLPPPPVLRNASYVDVAAARAFGADFQAAAGLARSIIVTLTNPGGVVSVLFGGVTVYSQQTVGQFVLSLLVPGGNTYRINAPGGTTKDGWFEVDL